MEKKVFNTIEAGKYLAVPEGSLRRSRMENGVLLGVPPPKHINIGRTVRYLKKDLDDWINQFTDEWP